MKYVFIFNGRPDKAAVNNGISAFLAESGHIADCETYTTKSAGDATDFVRNHCRNHSDEDICYVACGGDGTINEVISGMIGYPDKCFSVVACGTGNDFVKYYSPGKFSSPDGVFNGRTSTIDVIKVNDGRYCVNVCNIGFEAAVCSIANRLSAEGHPDPYRKGIFKALLTGRFNRITIIADNERLNAKRLLLCTLANSSYVGGGYCCAPRAKNDDGFMELCLVKPISLVRFISMLPLYRKGRHLDSRRCLKVIKYRRVRHVEVHSKDMTELCLDGEMMAGRDFTIEIVPAALKLIVPE